jgi:transposase
MNPRLRPYDRNQMSMMAVSLDELVAPEHEVRALWEYVEKVNLDALLCAIKAQGSTAGRPSFDPRILLALWLFATAKGVGSARELEQLCRENIAYRWLCADDVPNYHTLADFRTQNGALLDALLTENLALLVSEGLLEPEEMTVAHDGLRVRTSAGRGSFRRSRSLEQAMIAAKERIEILKSQTTNEPLSARVRAAQQRAARERAERVEKALEKMKAMKEKRRKKERSEPRVSTTDPEATRMKMGNGGIDPGYNIQYTTDAKSRVITAVGVGDCGSDYGLLTPAVEQHKKRLGKVPVLILADEGFAKKEDIIAVHNLGCEALVPDKHGKTKRERKHPALERWHARMADEETMKLYKTTRPAVAEWTNAQLRNRGFCRITVRGKIKARAIALWHALVHNIYQTISLRKRQGPATA